MDYKRIVEETEAEAARILAEHADDDEYNTGFCDGVDEMARFIARLREREEGRRDALQADGAKVLRKIIGNKLDLLDEIHGEDAPWVVARDGDEIVFATAREGMGRETLDRGAAEKVALRWFENNSDCDDCAIRFDLLSYEMANRNRAIVRHAINCLGSAE